MKFLTTLLSTILTFCLCAQKHPSLNENMWRGVLSMNDRLEIPFLFHLEKIGKKYSMTVINGKESIHMSCLQKNDSLTAFFPGIDAHLKFKIEGNEVRGYWLNLNKKKIQKIPMYGSNEKTSRFEWAAKDTSSLLRNKYRIVFDDDTDKKNSVGIFDTRNGNVQGTIMTETGDYRYLEGSINGNLFKLSTFNGIWAMLVEGQILGDSIVGNFYSGSSYRTSWRGKADEIVMLRKASSLTYVINDQAINFSSVTTLKGKPYRPKNDASIKLYQIMGSWCPNCLDEMRFFKELHNDFAKEGLEIIALAYENQQDLRSALTKLRTFRKRMEIPYTICYAGNASKEIASATFPMLNQVMSFPTSILVDRNGKIRHIHTGFSGPATGKVYEDYKKEMKEIIIKLIAE
jgi:thiol-disulfide isomerase/thioredoxin